MAAAPFPRTIWPQLQGPRAFALVQDWRESYKVNPKDQIFDRNRWPTAAYPRDQSRPGDPA